MDYHTHSSFSEDGHVPIQKMAEAAVKAGLSEIAVTDHCDLEPGRTYRECYDAEGIMREIERVRELYAGRLNILWGIELGQPGSNVPQARAVLDEHEFDFVIGSQHNCSGVDLFFVKFDTQEQCRELIGQYMSELSELVRLGLYDVVGHITYPLRYMVGRYGFTVDFSDYTDTLREMFIAIAEKGKGIELNLSGLRGEWGQTMPDMEMLRLYRECGGEIITLGSDAHRIEHIGACLAEGRKMLCEAGFQYVAAYQGRKPHFVKL